MKIDLVALCAIALFTCETVSAEPHRITKEIIEATIAGRTDRLDEVVTDDDGTPISVIGDFSLNMIEDGPLHMHDSGRVISEAYRDLGYDQPELHVTSQEPITGTLDVVHLRQIHRGLTVLDMEITAVVNTRGRLISLNGHVIPHVDSITRPLTSAHDALIRLGEEGLFDQVLNDGHDFVQSDPSVYLWENDLGFTLEYGWSFSEESPVWRYRDDKIEAVLSDKLEPLRVFNRDSLVTGPCNVRVRDFPRTGGFATSLTEGSSTRTEEITCEAADLFGTCYWQLRREPSGYQHAIGRVLDSDGGEQEVAQACSSTAVPQFTATNGDSLRGLGKFKRSEAA